MSTVASPANQECRTIQVIEPDSTLVVATSSGSVDQALDESGSVALPIGTLATQVLFITPKASVNYRFEVLYVDDLGIVAPFAIVPTVEDQTINGFTVKFSAAPPVDGFILRWRAVVVDTTLTPASYDQPLSIREQLVAGASVHTVTLASPRTTQDYGFNELRVENLIDLPGQQTPILAQVVAKLVGQFTVALSPSPPNNNYYIVARL